MTVQVKLFASLAASQGWRDKAVAHRAAMSVHDTWREAAGGAALPPRVLCARNHEYCRLDTPVADGDEVAFFPPVTGG
ncbi:MAG: MoaD/ThiS family protein [Gammaproteobacteria bacterium]|nr:MoaD/ThiS family protein [Gammaproteobacteria bacterium]MBI5618141.1 MoaD/ThiS family protein [Gammaproteobacteria bacterium]